MAVLDSSATIDILSGNGLGIILRDKYKREATRTTTITMHEVLFGVKQEYKKQVLNYFQTLDILSFDSASAIKSSELEQEMRAKGKILNRLDVFIAAICITRGEPLITTDKDFKQIPGLKILTV
ncbi:type II toxin-antitoxin system VapC family toxin [Candidatus Woesearchaeota archaeon]|nr:type II toxin-antitoxin system VapC family toxin [Candidatus Woesearchaeota archaeon]